MIRMTNCKLIDDYISEIRSGKIPASKEMHQACDYIEKKLDDPDVLIDTPKAEKAIELIERYFQMTLFPWERFYYCPDPLLLPVIGYGRVLRVPYHDGTRQRQERIHFRGSVVSYDTESWHTGIQCRYHRQQRRAGENLV